jgi:hypothetical protein
MEEPGLGLGNYNSGPAQSILLMAAFWLLNMYMYMYIYAIVPSRCVGIALTLLFSFGVQVLSYLQDHLKELAKT